MRHGVDRTESRCRSSGVSEVIGYTIIFGLVVSSVSLVVVGGIPAVVQDGGQENLKNAEYTFDVVHTEVERMFHEGIPKASYPTRMEGGTMSVGERRDGLSNLTVEVGGTEVRNVTISRIEYTASGTEIGYEAGGVFISEKKTDGVAMKKDPGWVIGGDFVSVSVPRTVGSGTVVPGSEDEILLETLGKQAINRVSEGDTETVTIGVESPNSDAWTRYFEELREESTSTVDVNSPSPDRVEIEIDVGTGQRFLYSERAISVVIDG